MIIFGAQGTGKYTQMLAIIQRYSSSKLKYEKKTTMSYNKKEYVFKISDIHVEVDMALLGCNAKILWNDFFNHIVDIVLAKSEKYCIIVCLNFHEIHCELLECYYSYMQSDSAKNVHLKFVIITEHISFIPNSILSNCKKLYISTPSKTAHKRCNKNPTIISHKLVCNKILTTMININELSLSTLREELYEILIYNIDIFSCIWYIIEHLVMQGFLKDEDMNDVLVKMYKFLEYYNNNYRPIYHLESFSIYLINKIHGITKSLPNNEHNVAH
jgi:hypothetical protein